MNLRHVSVLLDQFCTWLTPQPGECWVDATTGLGGHTRQLALAVGPTGQVVALDQDPLMLKAAQSAWAEGTAKPATERARVHWIVANFEQLPECLARIGLTQVDGVLADLGFCSAQMDDPGRGFSFQKEGPLDMRLSPGGGPTAADFIAQWPENILADTIFEYGEERFSRRIARKIVETRTVKPIRTTRDLAELVRKVVPRSGGIDPATRTFQALRIAVNDELGVLERFLALLPTVVRPGGRVGLMSFHSLEDRLVKQALWRKPELWEPLTKKPIEADASEMAQNPRSRSVKFRVARRVSGSG